MCVRRRFIFVERELHKALQLPPGDEAETKGEVRRASGPPLIESSGECFWSTCPAETVLSRCQKNRARKYLFTTSMMTK